MLLRPQKVVGYDHKNHLQHETKIFRFCFIQIKEVRTRCTTLVCKICLLPKVAKVKKSWFKNCSPPTLNWRILQLLELFSLRELPLWQLQTYQSRYLFCKMFHRQEEEVRCEHWKVVQLAEVGAVIPSPIVHPHPCHLCPKLFQYWMLPLAIGQKFWVTLLACSVRPRLLSALCSFTWIFF